MVRKSLFFFLFMFLLFLSHDLCMSRLIKTSTFTCLLWNQICDLSCCRFPCPRFSCELVLGRFHAGFLVPFYSNFIYYSHICGEHNILTILILNYHPHISILLVERWWLKLKLYWNNHLSRASSWNHNPIHLFPSRM